ncbi:glycosyl transferase [Aerococcus urinaehominis]|uniref:Glycosyl transferase n=1 Tax=Aerococcus urinaehominis TaxID=128944 RepID=A0A120IAM8_9LACT|nr:bifunctional glycosyltransferase family 2/GtrA family protein [Aerococcus urinaehominis]AMB98573.1 glycosyl transferase [Aerococcus urinaehominis]SDL77458.1 Putative flippase GtrA (transmembrane translocase of bactoprenol-linked glucose) [Aerococcus urinaehominis]
MTVSDIAIIIPSLEPDQALLDLLAHIRSKETSKEEIILINDGSDNSYDHIFQQAVADYQVHLIEHEVNYGKGRGLKNAFKYILNELTQVEWAVTIDSDGQHTYPDMQACINEARQHPEAIIFGSRDFQNEVPLKSKFGNIMTSKVLAATSGMNLRDTQTGLRVIPRAYLSDLLKVEGDRFEYEMNMILYAHDHNVKIIEVPIATIYYDENAGTHFNPISDSIKIYATFLRYGFSSILSFLVDIGLFTLILSFLNGQNFKQITIATVLARLISSLTNFLLNRYFVFKSGTKSSIAKYFSLVVVQMLLSSILVTWANQWLISWDTSWVKVAIDTLLFIISFLIQRKLVF